MEVVLTLVMKATHAKLANFNPQTTPSLSRAGRIIDEGFCHQSSAPTLLAVFKFIHTIIIIVGTLQAFSIVEQ